MAPGTVTQLAGARLSLVCRVRPGVGGVHETVAKPGAAAAIWSVGALVVCTAMGKTQKPPVTEEGWASSGPPTVSPGPGDPGGASERELPLWRAGKTLSNRGLWRPQRMMGASPRCQSAFADYLDLLRVFDEREAEALIGGGQAVN